MLIIVCWSVGKIKSVQPIRAYSCDLHSKVEFEQWQLDFPTVLKSFSISFAREIARKYTESKLQLKLLMATMLIFIAIYAVKLLKLFWCRVQ